MDALEATPRRCFVLAIFWGMCDKSKGGGGYPCRSVISIKTHSSSFVEITLLREVLPCQLSARFLDTLPWDGLSGIAFDSS